MVFCFVAVLLLFLLLLLVSSDQSTVQNVIGLLQDYVPQVSLPVEGFMYIVFVFWL